MMGAPCGACSSTALVVVGEAHEFLLAVIPGAGVGDIQLWPEDRQAKDGTDVLGCQEKSGGKP